MTDLAKIGLPLQIAGVAMMVAGFWFGWLVIPGALVHFVGDAFFFFQMKRQKCL